MLIIYAYVLTRRFWRDLEIVENSHAGDSIICNMDFYDAVYTEMSKEIADCSAGASSSRFSGVGPHHLGLGYHGSAPL